jgi:hypothetical protein
MTLPTTTTTVRVREIRTARQYHDAIERIRVLRASLARMTTFNELPGLDRQRLGALMDERTAELSNLQHSVNHYEHVRARSPHHAPGGTRMAKTSRPLDEELESREDDRGPDTPESRGAELSTAGTDESIASRAFELYCQRGREDGHDVEDWLQAERELRPSSLRGE